MEANNLSIEKKNLVRKLRAWLGQVVGVQLGPVVGEL
jgi:hypothetical protein